MRLRIDGRGGRVPLGRRLPATFAKPKSRTLAMSPARDEDVGGLDVAMNNAPGVGGVERIGDLDGQATAVFPVPVVAQRCDAGGSFLPETPWR